MIFYFSGTGNSLYVARTIARCQGEQLVSITEEMKKDPAQRVYKLEENEMIGFIYPIYAWNAPELVLEFVRSMQLVGKASYVFSVNTCGSEEGYTTQILQKVLNRKEIVLSSAFSISMPSNYVIGEDVERIDIQEGKFKKAKEQLKGINESITNRQMDVFQLLLGKHAWMKTAIVNPLFNKFARSTAKFYATDACIKCGLCQEICPIHTITVQEKPVWSHACTQCLACINRCPMQAIQYGKATIGRGRYVHPELKTTEN